jgi:hypothetical protein
VHWKELESLNKMNILISERDFWEGLPIDKPIEAS